MSYRIIDPPTDLKQFPADFKWRSEVIDYEQSDAYRQFFAYTSSLMRISVFFIFLRYFIIILLKRLINYELIPLDIRKPRTVKGYWKFLKISVCHILRISSNKYRTNNSDNSNPIFNEMKSKGVAVIKLPTSDFVHLSEVSNDLFLTLRAERDKKANTASRDFEDSRSYASRDNASELFNTVETILNDSGIMLAASKYLQHDASLIDINPQINDVTDNFWINIFTDIKNMSLPKSAYFHRDASGGDLKAIIYLTDVAEENGPFTYSVGSHNISISRFDDYICETNDSSGFSSTSLSSRCKFTLLPKCLRQKGSFGNDLNDESFLSKSIIDSAWSITADKGSIVLFDTKGIHRGGMVREGERLVLTCVIG